MMQRIHELNDSNFETLLSADDIAIVDLYAKWCGACRLFAPDYEAVALQYPQYKFYKIEAEENPKFRNVKKVSVDNLPFIAVFQRGEYVGGKSLTKKESLLEMLNVIGQKAGDNK